MQQPIGKNRALRMPGKFNCSKLEIMALVLSPIVNIEVKRDIDAGKVEFNPNTLFWGIGRSNIIPAKIVMDINRIVFLTIGKIANPNPDVFMSIIL